MSWPVTPIRRIAKLGSGHTPSRQQPEYWLDCTIPWLTLADVNTLRDGTRKVIDQTAEMISPLGVANSAAVVHPAGTVALSRTASVGFSCILGRDMATSQDFATWTCGPLIEPEYLLYALRAQPDQIRERMAGSTHKTIYMPDIETMTTPLPPLQVQRTIVKFLDRETECVDRVVRAKRRQAGLLMERRKAATLHGVIDGSATNRIDCSLTWAASLPRHWQAAKLTMVSRLGSGHTPSRDHPEWWVDRTIPWITTGEVGQMRSDRIEEIINTREMISELGLANSSATVHPRGTVVLCRTAASAGYSAIMGRDMATSQDFATWTCGPLLRPRYLLLCLRAMRRDLLDRLAMGSTHKTIYMPDIEAIRIPLPPVEEQDELVERTWRQLRAIDEAVDAIEQHVGLLQERKQALITAAVNGQLDFARKVAEEAS